MKPTSLRLKSTTWMNVAKLLPAILFLTVSTGALGKDSSDKKNNKCEIRTEDEREQFFAIIGGHDYEWSKDLFALEDQRKYIEIYKKVILNSRRSAKICAPS